MASFPPKGLSPDEIDAALRRIAGPGRVAILPVTGDSMLPTLLPGQQVAVELAAERPERGDLLLFRQAGYHVVHRYLGPATARDGTPCLRTRGDHVPALDPPLDPARVLGRVVALERDGAWWDLESATARLYGLGAALHDLFWAAAAVLAGRTDALLGRSDRLLRECVVAWDRRLLGLAHRLFLRLGSRRRAPGGPTLPPGFGSLSGAPGPG